MKGKIIGQIGSCCHCDWREEDYIKDVRTLAKRHAKEKKHNTNVEVVKSYNYTGGAQ